MAWSYSGDPKTSPKDEVRFILGDTDAIDPILSDEEIEYTLELSDNNVQRAAAEACSKIIAKYVREVDYTIGPESVKAGQRLDNWRRLLADIESKLVSNAAPIWTGSDGPLRPIFDVGLHDNIREGSTKLDG